MCSYDNYCGEERPCCRIRCCLWLIAAIVGALFLFTVGLLVGAAIAETVMAAMAAIIVLAVVLFIMTVVILIYSLCKRRC